MKHVKSRLGFITLCSLVIFVAGCSDSQSSSLISRKSVERAETTCANSVDPSPRPFSPKDTEVLGIGLSMSREKMETLLGKPESVDLEKSENMGDVFYYRYPFGYIRLISPNDPPQYIVSVIYIASEGFDGPRAIRVGDSVESVLCRFPDRRGLDGDGDRTYLYGKNELNFGYLRYGENKKVSQIYHEWASEDGDSFFLSIMVDNDKVKSILVAFPND